MRLAAARIHLLHVQPCSPTSSLHSETRTL
jgi:hypothetical protein